MKIKLTVAESSSRDIQWARFITEEQLRVEDWRKAWSNTRWEEKRSILHHSTEAQKGVYLRSCDFSNHPKSSFCTPWIPKSWIGFLAPGGVCTSTFPWSPPPKFVQSFQLNTKRWPYRFTSLGSLGSFSNVFFAKKKSHFFFWIQQVAACKISHSRQCTVVVDCKSPRFTEALS